MAQADTSAVTHLNRREALGRIAGAGLGMMWLLRGELGWAQAGMDPIVPRKTDPRFPPVPHWKTELRPLAPGVYAYIQEGGPGTPSLGISNAGLIVGDDLMAIDALAAPLQTKAFIAAARQATGGKSFGRLVNTHHHGDHTGGNQFFENAEIVGHPYCRQEVLKMIPGTPAMWEKREGWADGTEPHKVVAPSTTFDNKLTYRYHDTEVQFSFAGPAHTWGDIMAYLPQHKILFAGDLAFYYVAPFAHNGHVTKWIEAIDKIMAMDVDTIVPGHGPIGGKKELAELREYFTVLKTEVRKRYDRGMTAGQAAADISLGKFDNWMGPERIVMNTVRLYAEFKGTITPDVDYKGINEATAEYNAAKKRAQG